MTLSLGSTDHVASGPQTSMYHMCQDLWHQPKGPVRTHCSDLFPSTNNRHNTDNFTDCDDNRSTDGDEHGYGRGKHIHHPL